MFLMMDRVTVTKIRDFPDMPTAPESSPPVHGQPATASNPTRSPTAPPAAGYQLIRAV